MPQEPRRSKRLKSVTNHELCVFCEEDSPFCLHSYSTKNAEKSLRDMANEMDDQDMLTKIDGGDFVAIGLKYHIICLTRYTNKYRAFKRAQNPQEDRSEWIKGQAFAETVLSMEAAEACNELLRCHCKSENGCTRCRCAIQKLPCTELCQCKCNK